MRNISIAFTTALAWAALLTGCSGGPQNTPSTLPIENGTQSQAPSIYTRGLAPQSEYRVPGSELLSRLKPNLEGVNAVAVAEENNSSVEILNHKLQEIGTITNGLQNYLGGIRYDANQNLYVAVGFYGDYVQEYAKGATSPTFTYSAGLSAPADVTTDSKGNVYIADYLGNAVDEFAQASNTMSATCPLNQAEGIAVDGNGDVFASGQSPNVLVEFKGGLSGCSSTILGPQLASTGGLALDSENDLLACDQGISVDIIKPPYQSIKRRLPLNCFHISLNASNKLLFVASPNNYMVWIVKYPRGASVANISEPNQPYGVAVYPAQ